MCQQIWGQLWQCQPAVGILVRSGQMVSSSALETAEMGSVMCRQIIWEQFGKSRLVLGLAVALMHRAGVGSGAAGAGSGAFGTSSGFCWVFSVSLSHLCYVARLLWRQLSWQA
eukprot:s2379_g14.t1